MNYEITLPEKIVFEAGIIERCGDLIKKYGKNILLITGSSSLKKSGYYDKIIESLKKNNLEYTLFSEINSEPSPQIVDRATEIAVEKKVDCIVGIGGGSVIDTAKSVSALAVNEKGIENYLEGVGHGYKVMKKPLPFIAVPTTAGSGAEATKNAVITSYDKKYKKSFRDDKLIAKLIIVDPALTITLPKEETRNGGMDAICQLIESYTTNKANSFCKALSLYHIPKAIDSLCELMSNPEELTLRKVMIESSLYSGITLANSGLGAVHGLASGIGGMFNIPHGLICAILLPHIVKLNTTKKSNLYTDISLATDGSGDSFRFSDYLFNINSKLGIEFDFKKCNIKKEFAKEIIERSKGGSMNGNPVNLNDEELIALLENLLL